MAKLGVNIDHIATVRQARKGTFPDPLEAAFAAEKGGAEGITVHLREDRRHIQDRDVLQLRRKISVKLNLEMSCAEGIVSFACKLKPDEACLVPERREELTTEGGLNVADQKTKIGKVVSRLRKAGVLVSIFVDPSQKQLAAAREVGAQVVELHTGSYANAKTPLQRKSEFRKLVEAGKAAGELGLVLNAGHGLDYENVVPVARIEGMNTLNIGFSIVSRALFVGLENAVREMKSLI